MDNKINTHTHIHTHTCPSLYTEVKNVTRNKNACPSLSSRCIFEVMFYRFTDILIDRKHVSEYICLWDTLGRRDQRVKFVSVVEIVIEWKSNKNFSHDAYKITRHGRHDGKLVALCDFSSVVILGEFTKRLQDIDRRFDLS